MRAYFCGTRGSTPVSGAEQLRYGGHTSCIGLAHAGEPPTIVLDAGTGLQQLPLALGGQAFRGTLLLSHLHWDHTHGMPFFRSGTLPGSRVNVYLPEQGAEPEELLARAISAGTVLIQQGDQGDAYYAIAAGELDVRQDGHFLRRCGRGEGVGEIALLRAIPRTASVIAHTSATVYRLNREPFLTAVLGHAATQRRADQIASTRLATDSAPGNIDTQRG